MPKSEQGILPGRYAVIPRTLIFVFRGDDVLLIKGAPTKRLWANRYNGIGGHIERGEDVISAGKRELTEETGLTRIELTLVGVVLIDASDETGISLYVLKGNYQSGELTASPEGLLEWLPVGQLEKYALVEDLEVLLPRIYTMQPGEPPFSARYFYDEQDQMQIRFGN